MTVQRHVRGILFVDYVRMLRATKAVDWTSRLPAEDIGYLGARIDPEGWYPMAVFERMGNEILRTIASGRVDIVQLWGRHSAGKLAAAHPHLLSPGDPTETLRQYQSIRQSFFDFDAVAIPLLRSERAELAIHYYMGATAEEAAAHQTVGFFEGLLALAGVTDIVSAYVARAWDGQPPTRVELRWTVPDAN